MGVLLIHEWFYLYESIFFYLKDQFPSPKSTVTLVFPQPLMMLLHCLLAAIH